MGWSISGDTSKINYLSVLLSTNNGGSYTAISSNLSPSTQSFNYTPTSGQVTTTAVVWVRAFDSSGNALAGGISSGAFTIANPAPAPTITLNSPNAGATWQVGTSQTVGWSISGDTSKINYLSVLLSTNNGGSYTAISSNLSPSTQSFNYTPTSGQVTTTAVVWVRAFDSSGNALAGAISSGAFTIANPAPAPTITLNSPNAGATWQVGTSQTVGWSISGDTSKINYLSVLLSTNNGGSYTAISSNLSPSTQSFNYTPTSGQVTTTAVVWVRAFDSSGNALAGAISSGAFTIANPAPAPTITLNSPNAGATWQVGTSQTVGWSISGDTSKINYLSVLLSTNNGGSYTAISSNLSPSTQSFNYTPTSGQVTTTAVVWVRAFDSSGNALAGGISSGAFTIANPAPAPTITLNSPNAGATWQVGTSQTVGWSISGDTSKINYLSVLLSTNNGGSYTAISSNLSPSTQSFNYTPTSGQVTTTAVVWVRAFDSSGNALAGAISSGAFTIANPAPAPTITLNSPNAGATWQVGTSQTVGWSISGDTSKINYLSVLLSTNNGGSYTAISSNLSPSTQSFNYTPTSGQVTTTAVVWVRAFDSSGNALAGAISSGAFTIVAAAPTITLNSPNAGATWQVGTSQTVGWSISGDTSKINYLSVLLSTNNGGSYTAISSNLSPSTQSFNYTPTSGQVTTTAVVWVRAFDSSGNALAGAISSGAFTIANPAPAPTITLNSPNAGATWQVGTSQTVGWSISGDTSKINYLSVLLSTNNGGSYTAISSNLSPSTQSFNYTPTSGQVTTPAATPWPGA